MRLTSYLVERESIYGPGITFLDIDETLLVTNARVRVKKDGKIIKRLRNWEYLQYKPEEGEEVDFSEYTDADVFSKTSTPIPTTINRIRKMFNKLKQRGSRIVIVTGRQDFDDKQKFLNTFKEVGLPIDDIYVERVGNNPEAKRNLPQAKKNVIYKYLLTGLYRRARLIDDSTDNCKAFLELEDELPDIIVKKMREKYKIPEGEPVIDFYALKVLKDGSLTRIVR